MTNKRAGDTDTYIDMPKTDGALPITVHHSLLEKPPVLDKKVKVSTHLKTKFIASCLEEL